MLRIVTKLGPYGLSTAVTFLTGILSVPIIIALAGATQWTGLAIAQSVAALAAVVVGFGWTATGPTAIARMQPDERPPAYWRSLQVRSVFFVVTLPVAATASVIITGLAPAAAVLATAAYLLQALGGMWFFIGEARPYRVLLLDTLPRTGGILIALGGLWLTRSMIAYTAILLLGTLTAAVISAVVILRRSKLRRINAREFRLELVAQRHGVIATTAGSVYSNSPLIIASLVIPGQIDAFALAFKLYQYAAAAFQPVVQIAQGWIPAAGPDGIRSRVRRTLRISYALAGALLLCMAAALPWIAMLMSRGTIDVGYDLAVPFGICTAAVFLNQIVGLACLTAVGRSNVLAISSAIGAVVGVILLFALALQAGQVGLAWALCATETLVTAYQLVSLSLAIRDPRLPTQR